MGYKRKCKLHKNIDFLIVLCDQVDHLHGETQRLARGLLVEPAVVLALPETITITNTK